MKKILLIGGIILAGLLAAEEMTLEENQTDEVVHAQLYVHYNGSLQDVTAGSGIAARRSENVVQVRGGTTWNQVLERTGVGFSRTNSTGHCLNLNSTYCGNGSFLLNGDYPEINEKVRQGDRLALVIGENAGEIADGYMKQLMPRRFKDVAESGRRA